MVTTINEKSVRKPRHVLIDPEALRKARIEALRSKKTLGEWLDVSCHGLQGVTRITQ